MKVLGLRKNIPFVLLLVIALFLIFWQKPHQLAESYLMSVSEETLSSLLLISELKIAAASGASTKVPLIAGSFQGVSELLDQGVEYLGWANALIGIQLVLLALSQSIVLKVLIILAIIVLFFEKMKKVGLQLLVLFLLVNPVLTVYVIGIKYIAKEVNIDLGTGLNADLKKVQTNYLAKKKTQEAKMADHKASQLAKAKEKGKDKISIVNKVEDAVIGTAQKFGDEVDMVFTDTLDVLKGAINKLLQACLNLL
ncbi:MAG: hypothetical protein CMO34_06705, partial [Verrucomicrobia bacterium]|nr:hypothetical protein [Verrucomicrobiota bacterium]